MSCFSSVLLLNKKGHEILPSFKNRENRNNQLREHELRFASPKMRDEDWGECEGGQRPGCLHGPRLFCYRVQAVHVCSSSGLFVFHFLGVLSPSLLVSSVVVRRFVHPRDVTLCNDHRSVVVISEKRKEVIRDDFLVRTKGLVQKSCDVQRLRQKRKTAVPFTRQ